jgi:dTDP-4-amino-4,6-dideoxygalactose transaminase
MRYLRPWLFQDRNADDKFQHSLSCHLGGGVETICVGRARAGIYLLAKQAVRGPRRRFILSPYTIPDVINMVRFGGGEPVFVDCVPESTNIDVGQLADLIDDQTAAVMVTHYHQNQDRSDEILDICHQRGVAYYDDCALAIGAQSGDLAIGKTTDASVFSFSGFKTLNFFWGGAITTKSQSLAHDLRAEVDEWPRLRSTQYRKQVAKIATHHGAANKLLFPTVVFPIMSSSIRAGQIVDTLPMSRIESVRLDDTILSRPSLAALGEWNRKLDSVNMIVGHRRSIRAIYDEYFAPISVSRESSTTTKAGSSYVNYPIFVGPQRRNEVYKAILARGFDIGLSLYPNTHETAGFTDVPGYSSNVATLVRSVITLPTHTRLLPKYARHLADVIRQVVG